MGSSTSDLSSRTSCNTWHELKCPCPSAGCPNGVIHKWNHAPCGNTVYLNSDAFCKCVTHGVFCSIIDARWSCDRHVGDYRKGDNAALIYALTIAASLMMAAGDKLWAGKVIESIIKMSK